MTTPWTLFRWDIDRAMPGRETRIDGLMAIVAAAETDRDGWKGQANAADARERSRRTGATGATPMVASPGLLTEREGRRAALALVRHQSGVNPVTVRYASGT